MGAGGRPDIPVAKRTYSAAPEAGRSERPNPQGWDGEANGEACSPPGDGEAGPGWETERSAAPVWRAAGWPLSTAPEIRPAQKYNGCTFGGPRASGAEIAPARGPSPGPMPGRL